MASIEFEGQRLVLPGAYGATRVSSSLTGPLPAFMVPLILGHATSGHGYDAAAKSVTGETPFKFYRLCTNEAEVGAYFGFGSDIHRGAQFAFRHGLPQGYFGGMSPMVRASVIVDDSTTEQFTIHAKSFGPAAGWTKLKYVTADDILTIRPVKRYAMLSANLGSSATRAYIAGGGAASWLTEGATVIVGSNAVAGVSKTITKTGIDITSTGQLQHWIELSSAVGSACNTSAYALVLQYADTAITSPALTTSQGLIDYINGDGGYAASDHVVAVAHANFTNAQPADLAAETPIKEITAWGTATAGTCPATVDGDATALVTLLEGGALADFIATEGVVPHSVLLLDSDDTRHGTLRDYTITRRTAGYPLLLVTGCAWGDVVVGAGDNTAPETRAAALNCQDVVLCANGMDREAAAISRAAAVFGRLVSAGPGHNLTYDDLIYATTETKWSKTNLETLTRRGVVTDMLVIGQVPRYRTNQGVSTLQANSTLWNASDRTTWSVMQRVLMDAVERALKDDINEEIIGSDAVTPSVVAGRLNRKAVQLERKGWIKPIAEGGYRITSIALNAAGNGYDVGQQVRLPDTVDFITITSTILVG